MNNRRILIFFMLYIFTLNANSQIMDCADSISRDRSEFILKEYFSDSLMFYNHLLYSIADKWYLIIIEKPICFEEYYIKQDSMIGYKKSNAKQINKSNTILQKAFDYSLYHKGFINFNSDFYKTGYELSQGNITYFFLRDKNGNKYGEARLSVFVKPNPINEDVYDYLRTHLLNYISQKDNNKKHKKAWQ